MLACTDAASCLRRYVKQCSGGKVSFPALEVSPGEVLLETDNIIKKFADENGLDPANMWALKYFSEGMYSVYQVLFKHLTETQGGYPEALSW